MVTIGLHMMGTCVRDYIHIMDLADAHIAALNFILNNDPILFV